MSASTIRLVLLLLMAIGLVAGPIAAADGGDAPTVRIALIGMSGGVVETLRSCENEYNVEISLARFSEDADPPDLSHYDAVLVSFGDVALKKQYKQALESATKATPNLQVYFVGPAPIYASWTDWVGGDIVRYDPEMARYYGLSAQSMHDMLGYLMIHHFGRSGEVLPPGSGEIVTIYHPEYGNFASIADFIAAAQANGWDTDSVPRVALGTFRHHCLFHQPKVVKALIEEFAQQGILAVCLIADDPGFTSWLGSYQPELVVMTSHTREAAAFWKTLDVPRIHSLWFMDESIEHWTTSNTTGMSKSEMQHLLVNAEVRGATESLTAGGTLSGGGSGEEILPIPDRIERIVGRAKAWIELGRKANAEKRIAIVIYDHEADKGSLMMGAHHALNAPRSLVKFLNRMRAAGYTIEDIPADEDELMARAIEFARQMGAWEPGNVDRLARSGKAILVPEADYLQWFNEKVPPAQQAQMRTHWGEAPGDVMVWRNGGQRYLVLPSISLGNVVLVTQPPKGEALTATMDETPDESMLPPTHHFLATYFWMQERFHADAVIHFGSHGNEWLFPGKQAVISQADWSDMLIGNLPNINPWLSNNTAELVPCKRRARAVTPGFLPPAMMYAGLSDELLNLESTIDKYITLDAGALKTKFASTITGQVRACSLERELELTYDNAGLLTDAAVQAVSKYLHDLKNEMVPAHMHVLGEPPPEELLLPYLVHCMGQRFIDGVRPLFAGSTQAVDDDFLKQQGVSILSLVIKDGFTPTEAVEAVGARIEGGELPRAVSESIELAVELNKGLGETDNEIVNLLAALDARFVDPGPSGAPERNPGVVPTGRNLYVLNPEELPTRASWELACRLIDDYLGHEIETKGRVPEKVAFSLVPYATYSDFGIIESQILYLMGVRPVWNAKNQVEDIELIPAAELGRPRIDVFISARSIYREELPSLMKLIDKAIRLAASTDEPGNRVHQHSVRARNELLAKGVPAAQAQTLSQARMFGAKPEEIIDGHDWFFFLTERTGEWEDRDELLDVYMLYNKHVYTEGMWGIQAPEAYDAAIQDTELILKSWYDNRDFVLGNKFAWWVDGTLSMAIKRMTGREPGYMFVDVRNPGQASIVDSTTVVQRDFRGRLTNPVWIQAMMKEGYAGASIIARHSNNLLGWEITREHTVADSNWEDLTDIYVRDSAQIGVREWFDAENPHAFQKLSTTLLETVRKGYWQADDATVQEIATAYADSVSRHGPAGGIREGGNEALEQFVQDTLQAVGTPEANALRDAYQQKLAEAATGQPTSEHVEGQKMEIVSDSDAVEEPTDSPAVGEHWVILVVLSLLLYAGFRYRKPFSSKGA